MLRKSGNNVSRPVWMNQEPLAKLRHKKEACSKVKVKKEVGSKAA